MECSNLHPSLAYCYFIVKIGIIAMETIIFIIIAFLGLLLFLIIPTHQNTKNRFPCYEFRHIGEYEWHKISETKVMERLADSFDPVSPIVSRMLKGEEIIISQEIYRVLSH